MSLKATLPDFKGQPFHVGIDTHKSNWKITIRSKDIHLKTLSINPSPEELNKYMKHHYPNGNYKSVYETGFCGYWIHRKLTEYNFENIIVNPSDVPSTNKERDRKSDPIDSSKLSRELANNSLTAFALYSELIDINRFINVDKLASYVGLVPSTHSSDTTAITGGMSRRHCKHVRSALIESAWVAIRNDQALLSAFNQLIKSMPKSEAIIRIAKKLLNRIRFVWKNKMPYVNGIVEIQMCQ